MAASISVKSFLRKMRLLLCRKNHFSENQSRLSIEKTLLHKKEAIFRLLFLLNNIQFLLPVP